jgi:hypothetical protein
MRHYVVHRGLGGRCEVRPEGHPLGEKRERGGAPLVHRRSMRCVGFGQRPFQRQQLLSLLGLKAKEVVLPTILFGAESSPTCARSRLEESKLYIQLRYCA